MQLFRERRPRRNRKEREEPTQRPGLRRQEVPVPAQHVGGVRQVVQHGAGLHHADRMGPERERGDDPEVAAAAPDRPEQVAFPFRIGVDDRPVGEYDPRRNQVVDRQAAAAREMPDAAAEGQSSDAGRPDDPCGHGEAVLVRCGVDVAQQRTSLHAHHPRRGVDRDVVHRRQIDDESVVDATQTGAVVTAAADRDPEAAVAGELNRGRDIGLVGAVRDCRRMLVDHRVEEGAGLVVARVAPLDDPPLHSPRQAFDIRNGHPDLLLR